MTRQILSIWIKVIYSCPLSVVITTAERLSNSWLDVRHIEKYVHQGKSGTRELLWSWAQKNKTIGDLLQVLHEMGHQRAIHLIMNYGEHVFISILWGLITLKQECPSHRLWPCCLSVTCRLWEWHSLPSILNNMVHSFLNFWFCFWGWPGTCYVDPVGLELTDVCLILRPTSHPLSWVLGLKPCLTPLAAIGLKVRSSFSN